MLMNGIMMKDPTNVLITVNVMVSESVITVFALVMPDLLIPLVTFHKTKLTTLFMMTLIPNNVMLLLSTLNVTIKEMS